MTTSEQILQELQNKGYRITPLRSSIIETLLSAHGPWSIQEIRQHLSGFKLEPNKTTVYRQLEFLSQQNIVKEIDFGEGMKRYELAQGDHHHHLFCVGCSSIEPVTIEENFSLQEEKILKEKQFKISGHLLEFTGVCGRCQKKGL